MKKWLSGIVIIVIIVFVGCNSTLSNKDEIEIKRVIDYVLSYESGYDENINKYVSEETFYDSNYIVFYSYFLGNVHLKEYESDIKSINKDGDKYLAYMVINLKAVGELLEEESNEEDIHEPEADGKDVPVEVTLIKKNGEFYIEKTKEYNSLEEAIKEKKEFK